MAAIPPAEAQRGRRHWLVEHYLCPGTHGSEGPRTLERKLAAVSAFCVLDDAAQHTGRHPLPPDVLVAVLSLLGERLFDTTANGGLRPAVGTNPTGTLRIEVLRISRSRTASTGGGAAAAPGKAPPPEAGPQSQWVTLPAHATTSDLLRRLENVAPHSLSVNGERLGTVVALAPYAALGVPFLVVDERPVHYATRNTYLHGLAARLSDY